MQTPASSTSQTAGAPTSTANRADAPIDGEPQGAPIEAQRAEGRPAEAAAAEQPLPPGKKITRLTPKIDVYPEGERTRPIVKTSLVSLRAAVSKCASKVAVADMQNIGSVAYTVTGDGVQRPNQGTGYGLEQAAKGTLPEAFEECISEPIMDFATAVLAVDHETIEIFLKLRDDGPDRDATIAPPG